MSEKLERAVKEYRDRQARRSHPEGSFKPSGTWWPSEKESATCCNSIRTPSRAWPYSLMTHCRTAKHVAKLFGVDEKELRAAARKLDGGVRREGGDDYYKVVALVDGSLLSIFDGETRYELGVEVHEAAHAEHSGGLYVYASAEEALAATFPTGSKLAGERRVLIRVRASGSYCRYDRKLAFSRITPIEIVGEVPPIK